MQLLPTNLLNDSYFMFPLQIRWLTQRKESHGNNVTDKQDPPFVQVNIVIDGIARYWMVLLGIGLYCSIIIMHAQVCMHPSLDTN